MSCVETMVKLTYRLEFGLLAKLFCTYFYDNIHPITNNGAWCKCLSNVLEWWTRLSKHFHSSSYKIKDVNKNVILSSPSNTCFIIHYSFVTLLYNNSFTSWNITTMLMMKIWRTFDHFHLIFHHQMGSRISHCIIYVFTKIITSKLINNKKCDQIWHCPLVHHQPTYFTNLEKKNHCSQGLNDANKKFDGASSWSITRKQHLLTWVEGNTAHHPWPRGKTHDQDFRQTLCIITQKHGFSYDHEDFRQNRSIITQKHGFSHDHQDFQTKPLHHHPKAWILTIHVQLQFGNLLGVPHNSMNMLIVCCTKQITTN